MILARRRHLRNIISAVFGARISAQAVAIVAGALIAVGSAGAAQADICTPGGPYGPGGPGGCGGPNPLYDTGGDRGGVSESGGGTWPPGGLGASDNDNSGNTPIVPVTPSP
jgi:hypothetical protein